MDDLSAMLNQVMSNPDSMRQIQALASSLGLGGAGNAPEEPPAPPSQPAPENIGGADMSALASLLGGLQNQQQPQQQNTSPDLSALARILSGAQAAAQPTAPQGGGLGGLSALSGLLGGMQGGRQTRDDGVSTLTALLSGGNPPSQGAAGTLPNIDVGTIAKLAQALTSLQNNRSNIDLLLALKPRLKDERSKKVDDAIRVMQLIQFLPLIKESGLFGEMDKILGGLTGNGGSGGGLGGLLGNMGNGLGGLLGGLGRR